VARWRILAGPTAAKLVPARTVRWNGLDTTVKIVGVPNVVEVAALDAGGSLIGTSKSVRVH
jgi:phosphoribosylcarboxyaminoimidazole (NCAIR) mutase